MKFDILRLPARFRLLILADVENIFRPFVPPHHSAEFVALFDGYERFYFEDCGNLEIDRWIMAAAEKIRSVPSRLKVKEVKWMVRGALNTIRGMDMGALLNTPSSPPVCLASATRED